MPDKSNPSPEPSADPTSAVPNPGPSFEDHLRCTASEGLADHDGGAVTEPISTATIRILTAIARHRAHTAGDDDAT